jgi:hypothetical protein
MEVYFCTLLTRRTQMESSGKMMPTHIWHPFLANSVLKFLMLTQIGLVLQCPV